MRWNNEHIDNLYNGIDSEGEFVYDPSYFEEIEKQLPILRGRSSSTFFWINLILVLISSFVVTNFSRGPGLTLSGSTIVRSSSQVTTNKQTIKRQTRVNNPEFNASQIEHSEDVKAIPSENGSIESPGKLTEGTENILVLTSMKPKLLELNSPILSTVENPMNIKTRRTRLFTSLNVGLQQSWTRSGNDLQSNKSFGVESGITHQFNKYFKLTTGVSFNWTSLDQLEIKERTKLYGFGYVTYDNAYSVSGMASIGLPICISATSKRHSFGLLAEYRKNLFTQLKRVQHMDGELVKNSKGISDLSLLNQHSFQLGISYEYALNQTLSVGANARYELMSQISSDRFEGQGNNHPLSFNVSLRKYFGK
jgi:hypothetical protein